MRTEGGQILDQEVQKISKEEVRLALKRMKSGKAVGPADIPKEVWKCLRERENSGLLSRMFSTILKSERILISREGVSWQQSLRKRVRYRAAITIEV